MGLLQRFSTAGVVVVMVMVLRVSSSHDYGDALTKSILFFEGQRSGKLPANQRLTWRKDSALKDGYEIGMLLKVIGERGFPPNWCGLPHQFAEANEAVLPPGLGQFFVPFTWHFLFMGRKQGILIFLHGHVDLVGGYYDAGDNVKFNFPMAFSTTMLAWSVLEFGKLMGPDDLQHTLEAIQWSTDYFLKATSVPGFVFAQVGDPYGDHDCWERPEDMDTPRTPYAVSKQFPGSEVSGEIAAALAASAMAFRSTNPGYSSTLLKRARTVFSFADTYRGSYNDSLGPWDELIWAAAWLYKATKMPNYWNYVVQNISNLEEIFVRNMGDATYRGGSFAEFGWDTKNAGINILFSRLLVSNPSSSSPFIPNADKFVCTVLPESPTVSVSFSPGGLLFKPGGSNLQHATALSFLLVVYSRFLHQSNRVIHCGNVVATSSRLVQFAKGQVDYILGSNPLNMSYMVGYGQKFPQRIHHRGSSLPSVDQHPGHIDCSGGTPYFQSNNPNPNILTGAIVGGPDKKDFYADSRAAFQYSEPTTYINAPMRSGKLTPATRKSWRKDSAIRDGFDFGMDLVGGYYDAGDNVKFSFPMAFTTTMLAWSVLEFGDSMGRDLRYARAAIKWGSDYLLKATNVPGTVVAVVGDPIGDHVCWERPEDMDTPRTVYVVNQTYPSSELSAEIAAALAASSIVFKARHPTYSKRLLDRAQKVFKFADEYQGSSFSDEYQRTRAERGPCPFYCSYNGDQDELVWAATWLFKATDNSRYRKYVSNNINYLKLGEYEFGWDAKNAGINVLVSSWLLDTRTSRDNPAIRSADQFVCSLLPESNTKSVTYSPGGLLFKPGPTNLQRVTALSFLLLVYSRHLEAAGRVVDCGNNVVATPTRLVDFAKGQVDYILGRNPLGMSYMVGYSDKYPKHVHHRGSTLPSVDHHPTKIGCITGHNYRRSPEPDLNVLVGAIVGGPDNNDQFLDSRDDVSQSEPATYINAPFVGALAYFKGRACKVGETSSYFGVYHKDKSWCKK
ncbi:hypothetical protein Tsubulata_012907 [Turnera subulata]|uniref:Endoglucanase n=1 Tax=Turnera subulata TaxID=218843 RepID=A0A9Q0J5E6_9ROSI|nr:hypothetical protein Tsubulata_012907 [Turnera subulata]